MSQAAVDEARSFDTIWRDAREVEGWLTEGQARALYAAAEVVADGLWVVEIGSHCGRSTIILAAAKGAEVGLLAVDPFDDERWGGGPRTFARFQETLAVAGVSDDVRTFRGTSYEASGSWDGGNVDMLFIDGAHDRHSVLRDIDGWARHLTPQAAIFCHDAFSSPGVTLALFERYLGRSGVKYVGSTGSLAYMRRDCNLTAIGRIRSSVRMLTRLLWFTRNVIVKVAIRRRWHRIQRLLRHDGEAYPY